MKNKADVELACKLRLFRPHPCSQCLTVFQCHTYKNWHCPHGCREAEVKDEVQ